MSLVTSLFNVATGFQLTRRTVEEARYEVLEKHPAFEVRRYAARVVAEAPIEGSFDRGEDEAFRRLAAYIFAKRRGGRPIAMTTPVTSRVDREKIAMTTPVTETRHGDRRVMAFTLPAGRSLEELPPPGDPDVVLRSVPPMTVAAMRFSGRAGEAQLERRARTLAATVAAHGYRAIGPATLAQYDPPWVVGPLRRNEVLLEIERT